MQNHSVYDVDFLMGLLHFHFLFFLGCPDGLQERFSTILVALWEGWGVKSEFFFTPGGAGFFLLGSRKSLLARMLPIKVFFLLASVWPTWVFFYSSAVGIFLLLSSQPARARVRAQLRSHAKQSEPKPHSSHRALLLEP